MAGRGRGRGSQYSFNIEALGLKREDLYGAPTAQPRTDFPPLQHQPVPLPDATKKDRTLLEIKQDLHTRFRQSAYYVKVDEKKRDIERYSDRYQQNQKDGEMKWAPDWSMFPDELRPKNAEKKKKRQATRPQVGPKTSRRIVGAADGPDAVNTKLNRLVDTLSAKEETGTGEVKEEPEDEDEENKEEVEEEQEEVDDDEDFGDNDYGRSYFDNGEAFVDEDDDEDEPVYS